MGKKAFFPKLIFLILFFFSPSGWLYQTGLCLDSLKENGLCSIEENIRMRQKVKEPPGCCLRSSQDNEKIMEELEEAEKHLKCLLKERDILVGDFYGLNITAYRYINIFDRLRYIRFRIREIDEKIMEIEKRLSIFHTPQE